MCAILRLCRSHAQSRDRTLALIAGGLEETSYVARVRWFVSLLSEVGRIKMPVLSKPEAQHSLHKRGGKNIRGAVMGVSLRNRGLHSSAVMTTRTVENYSYVARFSLVLSGCPDNAGIMKASIKTIATYTIDNLCMQLPRPSRTHTASTAWPSSLLLYLAWQNRKCGAALLY